LRVQINGVDIRDDHTLVRLPASISMQMLSKLRACGCAARCSTSAGWSQSQRSTDRSRPAGVTEAIRAVRQAPTVG